MNPLTFLPLLAAVALAAPGAQLLLQQPLTLAQVPLTQTIHYENRPVVTGYQTTVVKPALASAPLALSGIPHFAFARQIPGLPEAPQPPADSPIQPPNTNGTIGDNPITPPPNTPMLPGQNGTVGDGVTPPPIGDQPGLPGLTPPGQGSTTPAPENGTASSDQGGNNPQIPIPGSPILGGSIVQLVNPAQLSALAIPQTLAVQPNADALVVEARSIPVAAVRAAQAGDFEPLVTKEKVLAPVRTHTQITPQLTQIQPEITVRKIVHDVPVATPVLQQQVIAGIPAARFVVA